jgi:DNA-binding MarR family transcriptional regulator
MAEKREQGKREDDSTPVSYDFQSDSLGYALKRAQVRTYAIYFSMVSALDISPAKLTALSLIAMEPGMNQAKLAQRLAISTASALRMVDALESASLVSRESIESDRRSYSLEITDSGRSLLATLRRIMDDYEKRIASELTAKERQTLIALLARVAPDED